MTDPTIQASKDALEEVLRVELSAADAYAKAVYRLGNSEHAPELVDLKREHDAAIGSVRNALARLHDQNDVTDSGMVGAAARAVGRVAGLFGTAPTLHALRAGEDLLLTYLATVTDDEQLVPTVRDVLADNLLSGVPRRIAVLDAMLNQPRSGTV